MKRKLSIIIACILLFSAFLSASSLSFAEAEKCPPHPWSVCLDNNSSGTWFWYQYTCTRCGVVGYSQCFRKEWIPDEPAPNPYCFEGIAPIPSKFDIYDTTTLYKPDNALFISSLK